MSPIPRSLLRVALCVSCALASLSTATTSAWASPDTPDPLDAVSTVASVARSALDTAPLVPGTPAAVPESPLIVIDPGHGGPFSNANANGLKEKRVNLQVSRALRDALVARGYRVVLTRETDTALSLTNAATWNYSSANESWSWARDGRVNGSPPKDDLQARVNRANSMGADLFISVHANGAKSRSARGYETFASPRDAMGIALSRHVQTGVIASTGFVNRGAKTADFYVLRWSNMPAILLETGFITNPSDAALLKSAGFRSRIAEGVANGVDAWMRTNPYRGVYPRIGGLDTSSHLSALALAQFRDGAPIAVLAQAEAWADVPGAASLAAALGGPLLWIPPGGIDTTLSATLSSLAPQQIVVVGRNDSVSTKAVSRIAAAAQIRRADVRLLGGVGAASVSASIAESVGVGPTGHVFVAAIEDTRTLLAAAAVAATRKAPLLVSRNGALSSKAVAFLSNNRASIKRIVLVGNSTRVPTSLASGSPYRRYSSSNFTALTASLNTAYHTERRAGRLRPIVADPSWAPTYLASSARAAGSVMPVLPIYGSMLPVRTRLWITNRRAAIGSFEIHDPGGTTPLLDHKLRKADYL